MSKRSHSHAIVEKSFPVSYESASPAMEARLVALNIVQYTPRDQSIWLIVRHRYPPPTVCKGPVPRKRRKWIKPFCTPASRTPVADVVAPRNLPPCPPLSARHEISTPRNAACIRTSLVLRITCITVQPPNPRRLQRSRHLAKRQTVGSSSRLKTCHISFVPSLLCSGVSFRKPMSAASQPVAAASDHRFLTVGA